MCFVVCSKKPLKTCGRHSKPTRMKVSVKDAATDSEEQKFKQKCKDLKKRIIEVEGNNEIATLALTRTKAAIRRSRLEYVILLERLEERAIQIPNGIGGFEEMASPPVPSVLDESLNNSNPKAAKSGLTKKSIKKTKPSPLAPGVNGLTAAASKASRPRDPDLPKRPTNAYLLYCEMHKESMKSSSDDSSQTPGDLSKSMTDGWKNLTAEERLPFYRTFEDEKKRYNKEMELYNSKKQAEDGVTTETEDLDSESPLKKIKLEDSVDDSTPEPDRKTELEEDEEEYEEDPAPALLNSEPVEEEDDEDIDLEAGADLEVDTPVDNDEDEDPAPSSQVVTEDEAAKET